MCVPRKRERTSLISDLICSMTVHANTNIIGWGESKGQRGTICLNFIISSQTASQCLNFEVRAPNHFQLAAADDDQSPQMHWPTHLQLGFGRLAGSEREKLEVFFSFSLASSVSLADGVGH